MNFVFRALTKATLLVVTFFSLTGSASAQEYVEFLIGDRTEETRKWGHVSLRVVTGSQDHIFDFGRYGRMWGKRDASEGEPILRVWKKGKYSTYRNLHLKDGGTTKRYQFVSNPQRSAKILDYFASMTKGAPLQLSNSSFDAYVANYKTFHAVDVNCTTVSIDAFEKGFPEYRLHQPNYSIGRDLGFILKGAAQANGQYDSQEMNWPRVWWPLDLMALLEEQYVRSGQARVLGL
ncbi:MAG: hypothetical protein J0L82_06990 [Deltaproteobacteria bacterium]|nr:hypothetical protein [Deltaproteobacteria bacterium]